jgi:hypothetical protein
MQPVITTLLDDSLASIGYPKGTHVVALPAENIWDGELMLAYDEMEESLVGHIFDSGLIDDRIKLTWPDGSEESFDRIELTVYGPVVGALGR